MTTDEAKKIFQAELKCKELSKLSTRKLGGPAEGEYCNHDCDSCEFLYAQGTTFDRVEALKLAIQALENQ